MNIKKYYSTGKRKTSISRVFIKEGTGNFKINNLNINEFCINNNYKKFLIINVFNLINININNLDIFITVKGGGTFGQLKSIQHGISRTMIKFNEDYRPIFKKYKLLTRDSRKVERKKVGFKKSRKKPQFSKR